jgi:signal transduction histidine kinase
MMAEALARQLARFDKPELGALAHDLADSLAIAVGESRALLEGLRGHGPGELVPACKLAAERFAQQDCGIEVETSFPQCPVIVDAATRHTVERAVGELLENVRLHSGAQKVSFTVTCDDGSARVCVADDGVGLPDGFDLEAMGKAGHFGLLGLRERMEKVSGKCDFTSSERGTTVALTVPLMARDSEGEVHASAGR